MKKTLKNKVFGVVLRAETIAVAITVALVIAIFSTFAAASETDTKLAAVVNCRAEDHLTLVNSVASETQSGVVTQVAFTVKNNAPADSPCGYQIGAASYKVLGSNQERVALANRTQITPGQTKVVTVNTASCNTKSYIYQGPDPATTNPVFTIQNNNFLIGQTNHNSQTDCGNVNPPAVNCDANTQLKVVGEIRIEGNQAVATVSNTAPANSNCNYQIGVASYKVTVPWTGNNTAAFLQGQQRNDYLAVSTLTPGASKDIRVNLPSCAWQVDVYQVLSGNGVPPQTNPDFLDPSISSVFRLLKAKQQNIDVPSLMCVAQNEATLTLIKTVINDNGGTKQVSDFTLFISGATTTSGVAKSVQPGTYTASERNLPGYTAGTWGGDCSANGSVTVGAGQHKTCTITNNDNPPQSCPDLNPPVIQFNGTNLLGKVGVAINYTIPISGLNVTLQNVSGSVPGLSLVGNKIQGTPTVGGTFTLTFKATNSCGSDTKSLTVVIEPSSNEATLTLIKTVINDNGGTKQVSDFTLFISGATTTSGVAKSVQPGTYTASERNLPGYTAGTWGGDCSANGSVTVGAGQHKTCTITNNDDSGPACEAGVAPEIKNPDPTVITVKPDAPISFTLNVVGTQPISVVTTPLPDGLTLNGKTISGSISQVGEYSINIGAENLCGSDNMILIIKVQKTTTGCTTGCGGGHLPPNFVARSNIEGIPPSPLANQSFVYLSEVPYTGVASETAKFVSFIAGLLALSAVMAYVFLKKKLETVSFATAGTMTNVPFAASLGFNKVPQQSISVAPAKTESLTSVIEKEALDLGIMIDSAGAEVICQAANNKKAAALRVLNQVVSATSSKFLSADLVKELLFKTYLTMVPTFVEWIKAGNEKKASEFLKMLKVQGHSVEKFIQAVSAQS